MPTQPHCSPAAPSFPAATWKEPPHFFDFAEDHTQKLINEGKRLSQSYCAMLSRLKEFVGSRNLMFSDITSNFLFNFDAFLRASDSKHGFGKISSSGVRLYIGKIQHLFNLAKIKYNDEDAGIIRIANNPFQKYKLPKVNEIKKKALSADDIRKIKEFPKADIVLGGFPCPGFSEAGPRLVDDKRNFLYLHFIRCLMQSKPKIFVAENVKGMMTLGKGEVFKQIVQDFAAAGYTIYHKLLNSAEYGVPQIRERVILVGVRNDIDFEYVHPEPTHGYGVEGLKEVVTLRDAIGDLEDNPGDYFTGSYSTIFMSRNRKKLWSQPSFTIQASGRQAPIHPAGEPMVHVGKDKYIFSDGEENNRRLSVKEIARIQTFPDWYDFSRGTSNRNDNAKLDLVYKQIGNAVPVRLALAVAEPIAKFAKKQLEKEKEDEYVVVRNVGEQKRMMA